MVSNVNLRPPNLYTTDGGRTFGVRLDQHNNHSFKVRYELSDSIPIAKDAPAVNAVRVTIDRLIDPRQGDIMADNSFILFQRPPHSENPHFLI